MKKYYTIYTICGKEIWVPITIKNQTK